MPHHKSAASCGEYIPKGINAAVIATQAAGQPVISIDTKKKEPIGSYKNGGSDYRQEGCPDKVNVHDFVDKGATCKTPLHGRANFYRKEQPPVESGHFGEFVSIPAEYAGFSTHSGKPVASSPVGTWAREAQPTRRRYVTRRSSCSTVKLSNPNIRWHMTLSGPRPRTVQPP